jgi:hypothetical protein
VLAQLVEPDAGAIDDVYITSQVETQVRALSLLEQLARAADTPVLQAQLEVSFAVEQAQLGRARQIADNL